MTETLEPFRTPILLLALLASGLQAGTYYAFVVGVMPGLGNADDTTFVTTMQQVNLSIVNPVFLATFVGAPLLAALGIVVAGGPGRPWAVAGLVLAVLTVVVTAGFNIPLNDTLAAVDPTAGASVLHEAREAFEDSWVRWNLVRALTSTAAIACLALSISR